MTAGQRQERALRRELAAMFREIQTRPAYPHLPAPLQRYVQLCYSPPPPEGRALWRRRARRAIRACNAIDPAVMRNVMLLVHNARMGASEVPQ